MDNERTHSEKPRSTGGNARQPNLAATAANAISDASDPIGKTAQAIGDQVSSTVDTVSRTGRDVANTASQNASSAAASLENFGRSNPLAAMGIAMLVGMVFGMMRRGRE